MSFGRVVSSKRMRMTPGFLSTLKPASAVDGLPAATGP